MEGKIYMQAATKNTESSHLKLWKEVQITS